MALRILSESHDSDQEQESPTSDHISPVASNKTEQAEAAKDLSNVPNSNWDPQHFKTLTTLGKGNYATIHLVESSHSKQLYAMKTRSKRIIHENSETEFISTEETILLLAKREKHPFVVDVFGGFQTQSHIMLYLEFCQGGSLRHHVTVGPQFDVERVR
jgi:serine/threonine protein kinase